MKKILLACAAGMSTSLMVTKMKEEAENQGLDYDIFAIPATSAEDVLSSEEVDVILLGPQLSYMKSDFERLVGDESIPIGIINMLDYGTMNGENTIEFVKKLLEEKE